MENGGLHGPPFSFIMYGMNRNKRKRPAKWQISLAAGVSVEDRKARQKECRDRNRKTLTDIRNRKVRDR